MANTFDTPTDAAADATAGSRNPLGRLAAVIIALPLIGHIVLTIGAFVGLGLVNSILNQSYEDSKFPVPYAEGQTTFNGQKLKGFYQVMIDAGTLDTYRQTQLIDFGFIVAMALLGLALGTLIQRLSRPGSLGARLAALSALLIPIGAGFDVIENLISFVLLAKPESFPNWLAIPYSAAAVIKFGFITAGILALLASLVLLSFGRSKRR